MADEEEELDEEEEEEEEEVEEKDSEFVSSDALIDWERIQAPAVRDEFHSPSQSPPPPSSDHGGGVWSTVHEDRQPSVVFPPINHEGIHHHHHHHHHDVREIDVERARPPSPVASPRPGPAAAMEGSAAVGWWDAGLEVLRFKFVGIVSYLRGLSTTRRGLFRSIQLPLAGSVILMLLFYLRFRRRRRLRREGIVGLIRIINEKDERIHQLLHQIARMNEILLTTHHGVPLISKAVSA